MNKRYLRNYFVEGFDIEGQDIISNSQIVIFGCGGLGSFVSYHLTAMGVGEIILVDNDEVAISNLQRQILYTESSIGKDKSTEAKKNLSNLNSEIKIISEKTKNIDYILNKYSPDMVFDCTDNYSSRKLIAHICKEKKILLCSGAVSGWEGWVSIFEDSENFTFEKIFDEKNSYKNCEESGVLSPTVGTVASIQVTEGIKKLIGLEGLKNQVLLINGFRNETKLLDLT